MGIETIYKKMQCLDNRELIKTGNINRTYCKEMFNQEKHIESIKLIFNDLINIKKKSLYKKYKCTFSRLDLE